jgi:hypothetical protein
MKENYVSSYNNINIYGTNSNPTDYDHTVEKMSDFLSIQVKPAFLSFYINSERAGTPHAQTEMSINYHKKSSRQ